MRPYAVLLLLLFSTMLAAQQTAPAAPADVADELRQMREAIQAQQKMIEQQQRQIDELRGQLMRADVPASAGHADPQLVEATMRTAVAPSLAASPAAAPAAATQAGDSDKPKESPLSFRIGNMDFTPGGFLDFTNVFRTTNVGTGIATGFGAIPFNTVVQGHDSEFRMSAQNSRLTLKVHGVFGANDITGYVEADFLGNPASNLFVTTNANTNRMRLYWLDLKRHKWEFVGGQAWSWLTPNRAGLSPDPAQVFFSLNQDSNYQVGLSWTRAAQFRLVYHPNEKWAFGVALENPQQYVGPLNEVLYPNAFNAALGPQFDAANNSATPNLHPDIIPKLAYDNTFASGRHFHFEVAGLVTSKKVANLDLAPPNTPWTSHTATGGAVEFATNVDVTKHFRFLASGFYGAGGGRYISGLGPDVVVRPNAAGTDLSLDLVTSGSGIVGVEAPVTEHTTLAAYYGGAYFDRNTFPDTTVPAVFPPTPCAPGMAPVAQPCIGFGGNPSFNFANRALQEGTFDVIQTLWSDRNYGKLQLITQFSYVTRSPWFVQAGAPKNAHMFMGYIDLRYILP